MLDRPDLSTSELATLRGIVRGPGNYATPSPERIGRLAEKGLIKRARGRLRPTIKGRLVARLAKLAKFAKF